MRRVLLTSHVVVSVGWFGALAVFLAHATAVALSRDPQVIGALSLAMALTAWWVILPFGLASLATGIVQALATPWGLVRHYWVAFKLLLGIVATAVLLLKLGPIDQLAVEASKAAFAGGALLGLRTSLAVHAAGGLVVLLAAVLLAVYKPAGRIGQAAPRWVRATAIAIAVLLLILLIMVLGGGHGPGVHRL